MSIQTFLKRPSGLLRLPGNTYMIYRPNRVSGSEPCVGSSFLSYAVLQTQSCLRMSSTANIRNFATLYAWDEDYPRVRWIEMKNISKNADWGSIFKAMVTVHRDKRGRARRVWTPFSGGEPTKKELAVEWPEDKQARV